MSAEALFIDIHGAAPGRRFAMHHLPRQGPPTGLAVYVQPFAEEMNKSRRMAALQSAALARAGWAVLQPDLFGCGDSDGEFDEARWDIWVDDIVEACAWLRRRHDAAGLPLCLWGLRSGCLLAAQAGARLDGPSDFLFWQPVLNGQLLLQQFLRLKLAGDLGGAGKQALDAAKRALAAGDGVEIAGYRLSSALADGLSRCKLDAPARVGTVEWFDLTSREDLAPGPAVDAAAAQWQSAARVLRRHKVVGPAFWQTTEIEVCQPLIDASVEALRRLTRAEDAQAHPA